MNDIDPVFAFGAFGRPGRRAPGPGARGGRRRGLLAMIVLISLAGCRESLTRVDSGVVAHALRPAVGIAQPLPGLRDIVAAGRPRGERSQLVAMWTESWDRGVAAGRPLREEVYRGVRSRVPSIDSAAALSAAGAVRAALAEAGSFELSGSPHLSGAVEKAGQLLDAAGRHGSSGDWSASALKALMAADRLREMSPRTVALSLVEAAEEVLGSPPGEEDGEEPADTVRARRLAWWGRVAIESGRYGLAIQRGYYACLLLGVGPP